MSKRAGNIVTLDDLIEAIGVDAARYALARYSSRPPRHRHRPLTKRTNDNPVFYVQYAHARVCLDPAQRRRPRPRARDAPSRAARPREEGELLARSAEFPRVVAAAADAARAAPGRALPRGHRARRTTGSTTPAGCCRWATRSRHRPQPRPALLVDATRMVLANGLACWGHRPRADVRGDAHPRGRLGARRRRAARPRRWLREPDRPQRPGRPAVVADRAQVDGALSVGGVGADRPGRASTARRRTSWTRPTSGPGARAFASVRRLRRLLRRQGVPVHRRSRAGSPRRGSTSTSAPGESWPSRWRAGFDPARSASTATTRPSPRSSRRSTPAWAGSSWTRSYEIDRLAEVAARLGRRSRVHGARHRRRRGAHPRVHRHRARGPEVRLLDRQRRRPRGRPPGRSTHRASAARPALATSAARSSTPSGFEVAARRVLALHARIGDRARRRAARARPRRRLRHRLHHPGRPVRPGELASEMSEIVAARVPRASASPCPGSRSSPAGPSSARRCSRSTRSAPSRRSSSTAARPHLRQRRRRHERQHPHRPVRRRLLLHAGQPRAPMRRRCSPGWSASTARRATSSSRTSSCPPTSPGRPARRPRHRRLLPLACLQLQPRPAAAGGRGAGRAAAAVVRRETSTTCSPPTWGSTDVDGDEPGSNGRPAGLRRRSGPQVVRLLPEHADDLAARVGRPARAGRHRRAPARRAARVAVDPPGCSPPTPLGLVTRADVDVVVEVIGGIEPART